MAPGSIVVRLGVFVHDWDELAADLRTENRREFHSIHVHDGVACCCVRDLGFWASSPPEKGRGVQQRKVEHSYH
jgi:hypothetical protein